LFVRWMVNWLFGASIQRTMATWPVLFSHDRGDTITVTGKWLGGTNPPAMCTADGLCGTGRTLIGGQTRRYWRRSPFLYIGRFTS
jgi:hypothetical protein